MALENVDTVDAIALDDKTAHAVLTIADSWTWVEEHQHLLALQAKLNSYFIFIESGQIWENYPDAKGRQLRINVIFRFPPPVVATDFLARASVVASELGVLVSYETFRVNLR